MQRVVRLASTAAVGLILGRFTSVIFVLFLASAAFLVAVFLRVKNQEGRQVNSSIAGMSLVFGVALVTGRLMAWFGIIGGAAALVLLLIALVAAGGDLM